MAEISNYKVAAAPHRLDSSNTRKIMLDVLIALLPCLVCGVVFFGLYSLLLVVICAATCFVSEQVYNLIRKKPLTFDLSALVTGLILGLNLPPRALILGLNLPPRAPWYIPVIGGVFAIIVVKMLFGGLGKNFANPAATARVFLLLAYSSLMTQYIGADISGNLLSTDAVTAPTYLGGGTAALAGEFWGVRDYWGYVLQLLFGYVGGCIGETCKVAILAGAVYLIARRVIDWRIPLVYILTAAVMVLACYGSASEILLPATAALPKFYCSFSRAACSSARCSWRQTTPPRRSGGTTASCMRSGWASSRCSSAVSAPIPRAPRWRF